MRLVEKALDHVKSGDLRGQNDIILQCLNDGSVDGLAAIQLLYEDMYDGITFNFELKYPAANALLFWKKAGIDALVEGSKRTPTTKNISLTVEILAAVAAGEAPVFVTMGIREQGILDRITEGLSDSSLYLYAKEKLKEYFLGLPDEEAAASIAGSILQTVSFNSHKPAKQVFEALACRWLSLGVDTINKYENALVEFSRDEKIFQHIFEKSPQFLDPMVLEVWPQPSLHGFKEPDFIIRKTDNSYLIVEIETPEKAIVTEGNQLSSHTSHALSQVIHYKDFLMDRIATARNHFPHFSEPECLVVIGIEGNLNAVQKRYLALENQNRKGIKIVGFDWISQRARAINENMLSSNISVKQIRMI